MVPLEISLKLTTMHISDSWQERKARAIVEHVMNHSQRIQKLCFDANGWEISQILSKYLFTYLPCLQHLDISHFIDNSPERKSWSLFKENTPALRTLRLERCSVPWFELGSSVLTTLHLSRVDNYNAQNTMVEFLAMLHRMPHLVNLSDHRAFDSLVPSSLQASAQDFLSSEEFHATPMISLPHLSKMSITDASLSAATALLSRVDIPLRTRVRLHVRTVGISLNDFVRLGSLLAQRTGQSDSLKFRSLTVRRQNKIMLIFSTSEHVGCRTTYSIYLPGLDDNTLLRVAFFLSYCTDPLDLSGIWSAIPLTNIQCVNIFGLQLSLEFWRDILALLSNVRHIRISQYYLPNITPMLSLGPSPHLARSMQDDRVNGGQGETFVPALEELELCGTILKRVRGGRDPDPGVADIQDLYDAIATRKETRCRLVIKDCRLDTNEDEDLRLESVGWWEGDQFRVTSNV